MQDGEVLEVSSNPGWHVGGTGECMEFVLRSPKGAFPVSRPGGRSLIKDIFIAVANLGQDSDCQKVTAYLTMDCVIMV